MQCQRADGFDNCVRCTFVGGGGGGGGGGGYRRDAMCRMCMGVNQINS